MTTTLSDKWEKYANDWIAWAREPGHDSFWRFHKDAFLRIVPPPPPSKLVVDVGCGEGRLSRTLKEKGYANIVGVEPSPTLLDAAQRADPDGRYINARGESIPLEDGCASLVCAFMVFHDVDDLDAVVAECARLMAPDAKLCCAIVHPINSAGLFDGDEPDADFVIGGDYFAERNTADACTRGGLTMTFHSRYRPLQRYSQAFEKAGLVIEAIREVNGEEPNMSERYRRWLRIPLFLHFRLAKSR